jgi:dTDP-4-dehydrorhamnose reductase
VKVLVTGAGGMLGRDVARAAEAAGHEALALRRGELEITDGSAVSAALEQARPDAVINCAAWTDVDGAEAEEALAAEVNHRGAGYVARSAADAGARLVHVSTDFVFDGSARVPYVESSAPRPLSAYGRTKLAGEAEVARVCPEALIVRSSWLFGAGGRNFVDTMLRLAGERDEVSVVDDQIGCPTWTVHLAGALVALAEGGARGIWHVTGGGSCSWFQFAEEIFRAAAVDCRAVPCSTAELGRPAPRPAYSVLASEREGAPRLPGWREGLAGYLTERAEVPG